MPTNTPITVRMDPATGPVLWSLEKTLIATTDRNMTPEEAGDRLNMDALLVAFGRWMGRGEGRER